MDCQKLHRVPRPSPLKQSRELSCFQPQTSTRLLGGRGQGEGGRNPRKPRAHYRFRWGLARGSSPSPDPSPAALPVNLVPILVIAHGKSAGAGSVGTARMLALVRRVSRACSLGCRYGRFKAPKSPFGSPPPSPNLE